MIRIVVDANVFVSAILTSNGNPAKILDSVRSGEIRVLASVPIIKEVGRVLMYPHIQKLHGFSSKEVELELRKTARFAYFTPGKLKLEIIKEDPPDNMYLECAAEGAADFIISGDHHLKDLKVFQGIKIIPPAEFIKLLPNP